MDISSRKLPIILIAVLIVILVVQFSYNNSEGKFIDPETCEIYIKDPKLNSRQYTNEFDEKCLDFKSLTP